jgi:hypothetical protein
MLDRYTKVVLTVIATALVALVVQNSVNVAHAIGYGDACGMPGHPACQVAWTTPMPVHTVEMPPEPGPPATKH